MNEAVRQSEAPAASAVPRARGRAIVVTSGKGGVGKTTTTANLGAALGAAGAKVVLVDADVGLRNLDIVLGLEARVRHHVLDVLEGVSTLDDALVTDKRVPSLRLLAAAQTREKDDVDTAAFAALISSLRERFDYVLIDCPAGIEKGFTNAIVGADEAIVVCTPEVSAVRDADRVVGLLGDVRKISLIVNRLRPSLVKRGKMLSVDDVNGILRLPLLGVIADAPDVIVSTNRGEPVALDPASPIGAAYRAIAGRLNGTDTSVPEIPREKSFLEKLFGSQQIVFEFVQRFFGKPPSSATARERLRLVLLSDHLSLAPDVVEALKRDLVEVISRYVEVDSANCDVTFEQQDKAVAMLANIPILGMRSRPKPPAAPPPVAPPTTRVPEPPTSFGNPAGASVAVAHEPDLQPELALEQVPEPAAASKQPQAADDTAGGGPARSQRRRRRKRAAGATNSASPQPT